MVWTAPMTAVDGQIFTASQFNVNIRDNLLETAPAKATSSGNYFVSSGPNEIAERAAISTSVLTSENNTVNNAFHDLTTVGPTVTITTGPRAVVHYQSNIQHSISNAMSAISVQVTGATNLVSTFDRSAQIDGIPSGNKITVNGTALINLNPGVNTFRLQYYTTSSTATYDRRFITVMPF